MKRLLDFSVSLVLFVVFLPLMVVVSYAIRKKLGSPVLFRQERPGLDGVAFEMVKFRTMTNAMDENGHTLSDAERMTPLGYFLRNLSIDELPGLWNVMKGEMSLVGPRPLLMQYLPLYNEIQAKRNTVKPGITGWAQVNGRNEISWEEKFELDVWYVENQSLFLDVRILFLTIKKVIKKEGVSAKGHVTIEPFRGDVSE